MIVKSCGLVRLNGRDRERLGSQALARLSYDTERFQRKKLDSSPSYLGPHLAELPATVRVRLRLRGAAGPGKRVQRGFV